MQGLLFFSATPNAIATAAEYCVCIHCLVAMARTSTYTAAAAAFAVVASDALEARAIKAAKVQL